MLIADQFIVPLITRQRIPASSAADEVITQPAANGVVTIVPKQSVVAGIS